MKTATNRVCVYVCACVRAGVRACGRAGVRAGGQAFVRACVKCIKVVLRLRMTYLGHLRAIARTGMIN